MPPKPLPTCRSHPEGLEESPGLPTDLLRGEPQEVRMKVWFFYKGPNLEASYIPPVGIIRNDLYKKTTFGISVITLPFFKIQRDFLPKEETHLDSCDSQHLFIEYIWKFILEIFTRQHYTQNNISPI
jgi:hypothetical protein